MTSWDEKTEALMGAALAGELKHDERVAFERLLAESPEAKREFESLRDFREAVGRKWKAGSRSAPLAPAGGNVLAFPTRGFRWAAGLALAASLVVAALFPSAKEPSETEQGTAEVSPTALVAVSAPERSEMVEPVLLPGEGLEDLSMGELALFLPEDEIDAIIEEL